MKGWGFVVAGVLLILWGAYQMARGWGEEGALFGIAYAGLGLVVLLRSFFWRGRKTADDTAPKRDRS